MELIDFIVDMYTCLCIIIDLRCNAVCLNTNVRRGLPMFLYKNCNLMYSAFSSIK